MNNSASQFMDKKIMDLSKPQAVADGEENIFVDFLDRQSEKKEDVLASYDFMPIRKGLGSASTMATFSSDVDTGDVDFARRTWNSLDSKSGAPSIRSYNALDADESAKFSQPKQKNSDVPSNFSLVWEMDMMLKKNMESVTHCVDTMSAQLSQLETRTRNLENSIHELKESVHNNHGSIDGRMRLLENILNEVRNGVGIIKDKQEIMEAQLQIAKLQVSPVEKDESNSTALADPTQGASGNQQFPSYSLAQPPQSQPALPPPPNQNLQLPFQPPARESYFLPSTQTPENPPQQYQVSAPQPPPQPQLQPVQIPQQQQYQPPSSQPPPQPQLQPVQIPQQQQYQSPSPQPQYPQQPPPSQPPPAMPSQQPPTFSAANPPSMLMPPYGQNPEEASYAPPQTYPPSMHPSSSRPPTGLSQPPPPEQPYGPGPTPNTYFPLPSRTGPGFSGPYGPPGGTGEAYPNPYNNPQSQYGGSSHLKPQQRPQLPTARILPEALPTAAPVGSSSSGSGGSGSKIPTDDVVDRVAAENVGGCWEGIAGGG